MLVWRIHQLLHTVGVQSQLLAEHRQLDQSGTEVPALILQLFETANPLCFRVLAAEPPLLPLLCVL